MNWLASEHGLIRLILVFVVFFIVGVVGKTYHIMKQKHLYVVTPTWGAGVYKFGLLGCTIMVFPIAFSLLLNIIRFAKS